MSYKKEIMSEKDKEYLASFNFNSYVTRKPLAGYEWTIDRDNESFLIYAGGEGFYSSEIPMFFNFVINNTALRIETFFKGSGNDFIGISRTWKIARIIVPKRLKAFSEISNEEIVEKIKEALTAYSRPIDVNCSVDVSFEYISPILLSDGEAVR